MESVGRSRVPVELPGDESGPAKKIANRLAVALGLIAFVALITYLGRDGYVDPENGQISVLDSFYYSTVSITTTGYGDIRPESETARLLTTILVTPARVVFLILLVGTTLEILAERSRQVYRLSRWRKHLREHTIVCGYGTKGRAAVRTLLGRGIRRERIVVIEPDPAPRAKAVSDDLAVVAGNATSRDTLAEAGMADAEAVIVAVDRDDTGVLITLTCRELNENATIVAAVREDENAHLLHQSGADAVITSSGAAGRLLGLSAQTPQVTEVLEDLLTVGEGLDIVEREIDTEDAGPVPARMHEAMLLGVVRDGDLIRFDDDRAAELRPGDRVVELTSHKNGPDASPAPAEGAER